MSGSIQKQPLQATSIETGEVAVEKHPVAIAPEISQENPMDGKNYFRVHDAIEKDDKDDSSYPATTETKPANMENVEPKIMDTEKIQIDSTATTDKMREEQREVDQELQEGAQKKSESAAFLRSRGGKVEKVEKRGGSRRSRRICCRRNSSSSNGEDIELQNEPSSKQNESTEQSVSTNCPPKATDDEVKPEDVGCCSCLSKKFTPIFDCLGKFFMGISIIGLVKSLMSVASFLYDIISDLIVGKQQLDDGEPWWGFWIIFLTFVPNIVFAVWFAIAHRGELGKCEAWPKLFFAGMVQIVTIMNLILGILVAFKPNGIELGGVSFTVDSVTGNCNFFRTVEGFMEALPQSTYQLSIMMRTEWGLITSPQIFSVAMSVITLSMTASTYLFYNHRDYVHYDEELNRRYRGLNNPPLVSTLVCTVFYLLLTPPRIWANALVLSITPVLTPVLFFPDILFSFWISHLYALDLRKTKVFPSGIVTAVFNFLCPCTPVRNLGKINLFSTLFIALKVILLYPITHFNILNSTVNFETRPDQFRCWNETYFENTTLLDEMYDLKKNPNTTTLPRKCDNESPNQYLFETVLPVTIASLLVVSIPAGFLISKFISGHVLTALNNKITSLIGKLKHFVLNFMKCSYCCESKEHIVDNNADIDKVTSSDVPEVEKSSLEQVATDSEDIEPHDVKDTENQTVIEILPEEEVIEVSVPGNSTGCGTSMMTFLNNVRHMFDTRRIEEERGENSHQIVIAGGDDPTSYVLHTTIPRIVPGLYPGLSAISFHNLTNNVNSPPEFKLGFSISVKNRIIMGGGYNSSKDISSIYELDMDEYHTMPSMHEARHSAGVCYIDNNLLVSGGRNLSGYLDSMEMLEIGVESTGTEFIKLKSTLPYPVSDHTLSSLNGKVIMIGGFDGTNFLDKVWEGSPDFKNSTIAWKEMSPMPSPTAYHFSVALDNKILVIGDKDVQNPNIYFFNWDGEWTIGPSVPCPKLSKIDSGIVLGRNKQIIITTNDGLITFDPTTWEFSLLFKHFKLREYRERYVATLQ